MARKKKTRTVSDVIEDIRDLHDKEEDLLQELEDLTEESDIDEGDE
jgi:iron-sulfur cluster repair protein YtfE (RIC family)